MQQHIGVLILRTLGPIALRISVGRDVKGIFLFDALDVPFDVGAELRIDLVEHIGAIVQRPHLPDRLVTHASDNAADLAQHGVGR